ncbi:MAG: hypothetical protein ACYS8X_01375 [Planctomycetota bacterium]
MASLLRRDRPLSRVGAFDYVRSTTLTKYLLGAGEIDVECHRT